MQTKPVLLTPKVPKVALIATQRPHAKMYAARYPPHHAGPPAHIGGYDRPAQKEQADL